MVSQSKDCPVEKQWRENRKDRASMWEEDRETCAPVQLVETNLLEYLCLFL